MITADEDKLAVCHLLRFLEEPLTVSDYILVRSGGDIADDRSLSPSTNIEGIKLVGISLVLFLVLLSWPRCGSGGTYSGDCGSGEVVSVCHDVLRIARELRYNESTVVVEGELSEKYMLQSLSLLLLAPNDLFFSSTTLSVIVSYFLAASSWFVLSLICQSARIKKMIVFQDDLRAETSNANSRRTPIMSLTLAAFNRSIVKMVMLFAGIIQKFAN